MDEQNNDIVFGQLENDKEKEQNKEGDQQPEVKKRKKVDIFRYKPEILSDPEKGLVFLYDQIKQTKFNTTAHVNELTELDKYIKLVQEWHYFLVPKFDFEFFLDRTQRLGTQGVVKSQLQQMRKAHKGIIPWDYIKKQLNDEGDGIDIGVDLPQENLVQNPDAITLTQTEAQYQPFLTQETFAPSQLNTDQAASSYVPPSNRKKITLKPRNTQKSVSFSQDSGIKQMDQIVRETQMEAISQVVDEEDFDQLFDQIAKIKDNKQNKEEIFESQ